MEAMSELHKWVKRQEEAGVVESSGSFSIEKSKAWEKLGKFQLPFDAAWALKFVQAACVNPQGASLSVVQTRAESTFTFIGIRNWHHAEMEEAIFDGHKHQLCRELKHLSIGIRVLAQSKTTAFSLRYSDGEFVIWNGQEFVWQEKLAPSTHGLQIAVCHFDIGQSKSIFSKNNFEARDNCAQIAKALTDFCHLSPIHLTLDRRTLNGFVNDPTFGKTPKSCPLAFITTEMTESLPGFGLAIEGLWTLKSQKQLPSLSRIGAAAILSCFLTTRNSGSFNVGYKSGMGESLAIWLVDGVCYKRTKLGLMGVVGMGLLINCNGLETDLSGLSAIKSQGRDERFLDTAARILPELRKFREAVESPNLTSHRRDQQCEAVKKSGWTFLTNPFVGIIELIQLGFGYLDADNDETFREGELEDSLERLILKLQTW